MLNITTIAIFYYCVDVLYQVYIVVALLLSLWRNSGYGIWRTTLLTYPRTCATVNVFRKSWVTPFVFLCRLDSSDVKVNKSQPLGENIRASGLFEQSGHNQRVTMEEENCRVVVEVQSLENNSGFWQTRNKFEDVQAKVIGPVTQSIPPMKNERCGDKGHVTYTGGFHRGVDESVSAEFGRELPPWKKQILVNRMLKEKAQERADREKVLAFLRHRPHPRATIQ